VATRSIRILLAIFVCSLFGTAGAVAAGPDVIVADMEQVLRWGRIGDITAYSVATNSCNFGDTPLNWDAVTSDHPVIAQNLYRLKDGRFEQVGQSWLKHGFLSANESFCGACQHPGSSQLLGIGCSDPYGAGLNGNQSLLGPRSEVNASTGEFPYPFDVPGSFTAIERRLQVHDADIDPDLNPGALYYVEGQYVTLDDAAAGNKNNNASYRRVTVNEQAPPSTTFIISVADVTQQQMPAILAWQTNDPSVAVAILDVPGEGRFYLAAKATDLANGFWDYEYALHNLNSHRSAGSVSVAIDPNAAVASTGFHDVDYHSGEPYDPTDWTGAHVGGAVTWSTVDFAANPDANAVRWGTLYNFRFIANSPPVADAEVTVGLFRPGSPASLIAGILGPDPDPPDCDENGTPDYLEIQQDPSLDCDSNGNLDLCDLDCNSNGSPDACDIAQETDPDCNGNGTPDSCDIASASSADCNGDGTPDECEIIVGSPAPGGPFFCNVDCDPDCNSNGTPDDCDIDGGFDTDCDGNQTPDACDIAGNPALDCNGNDVLDACGEIDCNNNSTPDDCEHPACPGILKGDMDCTTLIDLADVPLFVEQVLSGLISCQVDYNLDAKVDALDLQGFISDL